jgi:hypothetical protein
MRTKAVLLLLTLSLVFPASNANAAARPVSLDDVLNLVNAKVGDSIIVRQAASAGCSFSVGVAEVLKLKEAGAGDALIESLMKIAPPDTTPGGSVAVEGGNRSLPFRTYTETTSNGEKVLHVTNLDQAGRRIGGEVPPEEHVAYNLHQAREPEPAREGDYGGAGNGAESGVPVVVNVYPPAADPYGQAEHVHDGYVSPFMYRDPYDYQYMSGTLPGYYPGYFYGGYPCRTCGVGSPPGSHHPGRKGCGLGPHAAPRSTAVQSFAQRWVPIGPASARQALPRMRANVRVNR